MQTKTCKKCGEKQTITEFYKHFDMADGHLNICKQCVKQRVNNHRVENIDKIRAYDRARGTLENRKKVSAKNTKKKRQEVKGYAQSHNVISRLLKKGEIMRPKICQVCGKECTPEAHHSTYDNPKNIVWLCKACHAQYHTGKSSCAGIVRGIVDLMFCLRKEEA